MDQESGRDEQEVLEGQLEDNEDSSELAVRRGKLQQWRELGVDPFGERYEVSHRSVDIRAAAQSKTREELEDRCVGVKIDGRLGAREGHRKAALVAILGKGGGACWRGGGTARRFLKNYSIKMDSFRSTRK